MLLRLFGETLLRLFGEMLLRLFGEMLLRLFGEMLLRLFGEMLLRLFVNTLSLPSVRCWSVYLSICRLCVVCGWESYIITAALIPDVRDVCGF
jgi:hypothetical protein